MEFTDVFITLAVVFGLFMAWGIGANDVANAMATSVGSKALTLKQAIVIAAIFEFAGAYLAGGEVTKTIRKGILDSGMLVNSPDLVIYGMLAALLASGIWLLVATRMGWPVSTTHSIVGAIVGFAIVGIGIDVVQWGKVGSIVASWVISPILSGLIAFLLFMSVQKLILLRDDPLKYARRYVPVYMFLVGFIVTLVTLFKGMKHIGLHTTTMQNYSLAVIFGILVALAGKYMINKIKIDPEADRDFHFTNVEKIFGILMMITACAMAFAHGSNDVANAVGPMAAVVSISQSGVLEQNASLPPWILAVGGAGIIAGLIMYGKRVIATVGKGITDLTPSRGFAATLAAATTVVIASGTGLPISTTHTLVGGILGVGFARGIGAVNMRVVRTIFMSWIVTLPAGAFLSIMFFFMLKGMFSG